MINDKPVLAIIPARGGSKRLPGKNIRPLGGKPLIAWTIEEAKKSKYIDTFILSSDDDEIIKVAKEWGCEVPFKRPKELAEDNSPTIDTIIHAINSLKNNYHYICLLQPTSPLRKVKNIDECIVKCDQLSAPSCVSVTEIRHSKLIYSINESEKLVSLFPQKKENTSISPLYKLNGALYISTISNILENRSILSENTVGYQMDETYSIDIDTELDFKIAEMIINTYDKSP